LVIVALFILNPRSWSSRISGNKKNNNNKGSDSEDVERIVSLYEEKSKNFIRIIALLLGLSVLFLFMIFLPYVFTLRDSDQTFQTLREVQEAKVNFTSAQNDTTKLTSYLGDNPKRLFEFYERLIGNYINHYDNCLTGNYDFNSRLIQTTDSEEEKVARNIRDNNLWFLDVCNRLNITKPPVLGTVLLFYRSNISDPARAYATWGPDKDIEYFSPQLTKEQV
jgi:hypothetical protein